MATVLSMGWRSHDFHWSLMACLALALGICPRVALAQVSVAPYASVALGVSDIRTRVFVRASPSIGSFSDEHSKNVLAAVNTGIEFGRHFAVDAGLRSTLGIGRQFRVFSFGSAVRWGRRVQAHLRGGFGMVQQNALRDRCGGWTQDPQQEPTSIDTRTTCPYSGWNRWESGFDFSAGISFPSSGRWIVGPFVWWAESTSGAPKHRSVGIGTNARYR